jgi:tyrosyl-tRNA synthetase
MPDEMPELKLSAPVNIVNLIVQAGLAATKSEARRLIEQHGVKLDGQTVESVEALVEPSAPRVLQVGKRKFLRLIKA